eukprot:Skav217809  [mRNA]  locus=scaffold889:14835:16025:- [translate_table: standard]
MPDSSRSNRSPKRLQKLGSGTKPMRIKTSPTFALGMANTSFWSSTMKFRSGHWSKAASNSRSKRAP